MERICPLLGLAADQRTVVDGFDPEHRCLALEPPGALDRSRQVQLCLTEAHLQCERLAAARHRSRALASAARVAPDVAFVSTRLVLEPEAAWRTLGSRGMSRRTRGLLVVGAGTAAAALAVAVASNAGFFAAGPTASPGASLGPSLSVEPTPSVSSVASSSQPPPSEAPTATPIETVAATPAPTQRTYTVQLNDTLGAIAARFGTTVTAIQQANGLGTSTIINVGQVLIIP